MWRSDAPSIPLCGAHDGMKAFMRTHPVLAYFALTFTISWGGVLLVIGGPAGMSGTTAQALATCSDQGPWRFSQPTLISRV